MPELIEHGVTGFLLDDVETAVATAGEMGLLDRAGIRAQAVARFGRDRMVGAYLDAYAQLPS
jgi:hypothetical protein